MFGFIKKVFSSSEPVDELSQLNADGLRAFLEGDIEHFKKVDNATYNLFLKFRQDFVQSIAEITPEGKFERFKANVTNDQVLFVTKHAKTLLNKILALKKVNAELEDNFRKAHGFSIKS